MDRDHAEHGSLLGGPAPQGQVRRESAVLRPMPPSTASEGFVKERHASGSAIIHAASDGGPHRVAGLVLDSTAFTLTGPSGTIGLERLPMELLLLLARRPGTLVSREEIRSALWGAEVHIEHDAAINTAIRKVRQALGDDPAQPRFVQTVVGKGYRFAAAVRLSGRDLRFTLTFRSRDPVGGR